MKGTLTVGLTSSLCFFFYLFYVFRKQKLKAIGPSNTKLLNAMLQDPSKDVNGNIVFIYFDQSLGAWRATRGCTEDLFLQSETLLASPDFKEKKRREMEEILAVQNTFGQLGWVLGAATWCPPGSQIFFKFQTGQDSPNLDHTLVDSMIRICS